MAADNAVVWFAVDSVFPVRLNLYLFAGVAVEVALLAVVGVYLINY